MSTLHNFCHFTASIYFNISKIINNFICKNLYLGLLLLPISVACGYLLFKYDLSLGSMILKYGDFPLPPSPTTHSWFLILVSLSLPLPLSLSLSLAVPQHSFFFLSIYSLKEIIFSLSQLSL